MRKKIIILLIMISTIIGLASFFYFENNDLHLNKYDVYFKDLPSSFEDYKILQISDLHNKVFGDHQGYIVKMIKDSKPDMIAITGDFIDSDKDNEEDSLQMVRMIKDFAPTYFITGNHEWSSKKVNLLEDKLSALDVKVLRNERDAITRNNQTIYIMGVDDPIKYAFYDREFQFNYALDKTMGKLKESDFTVLLSHRPEKFENYASRNIDLILAGHAHGGQFRIPFLGGVIAPNQGYFPKYTSGPYHTESGSTMVVSRGLGNSTIPQRIFNKPELVLITLHKGK